MKFLHIADVHLGCTRYQLAESPRDFYEAWIDVLRRYAIDEKVEFVVMAGDFFHKKAVPPETMNYAFDGLSMLRDAGIPVVAIEGNHDQKHTDSAFSWLRSLSSWGLLTLLEPVTDSGTMRYEPWNEQTKKGGFVDIGRARIFGSHWYGASTNIAIPMLIEAIKENRREGAFHILMLHTDVEGYEVHKGAAPTMSTFQQLRSAVEYVALGHTHRHYEIDNWAFNPGSIEITNISEFRETRGVFVVDVDDANHVTARHVEEYHYRPFRRISHEVTHDENARDVTARVLEKVAGDAPPAPDEPAPIIEITLTGRLGFPNSTLEMQKMRDEAKAIAGALHVRIKNHTVPAGDVDLPEEITDLGRDSLERRVIDDLVARDNRYKARQREVSDAVIGAKRMALGDEPAEKIADFIAHKVCQRS
jgi:exonuclease SbcD